LGIARLRVRDEFGKEYILSTDIPEWECKASQRVKVRRARCAAIEPPSWWPRRMGSPTDADKGFIWRPFRGHGSELGRGAWPTVRRKLTAAVVRTTGHRAWRSYAGHALGCSTIVGNWKRGGGLRSRLCHLRLPPRPDCHWRSLCERYSIAPLDLTLGREDSNTGMARRFICYETLMWDPVDRGV